MANPSALAGHNGVDPEKSKKFISRVENVQAEMETWRSQYMNKMKEARGDIREIYTEVKDAGISVKAMKIEITDRIADRKRAKRHAGLEPDDMHALEQIKLALGEYIDTPLGAAAMAAQASKNAALNTVA